MNKLPAVKLIFRAERQSYPDISSFVKPVDWDDGIIHLPDFKFVDCILYKFGWVT